MQMMAFSISLQHLQTVAHVGEECCHCSFKVFLQAQAVFEGSRHELIALLFDPAEEACVASDCFVESAVLRAALISDRCYWAGMVCCYLRC